MSQTSMKIDENDLKELDNRRGSLSRPNFLKELLAGTTVVPQGEVIEQVDLDLIDPNPYQSRKVRFEDVTELAYDIYERGLMQPPLGRRMPNGRVQLAFGGRRNKSFELIVANGQDDEELSRWEEFTKMPIIIKPLTDLEMYMAMATENGQRSDPNLIELAMSMAQGKELFGLTNEEVGRPHGFHSKGQVGDILSILTLPQTVIGMIRDGMFGTGKNAGQSHGKQLVRMVNAGISESDITTLALLAAKQEFTVSILKTRVDNEINMHKLKTSIVTRHCPDCGLERQFSEYAVNFEGSKFEKCLNGDSNQLKNWLTPENQIEKERIMGMVANQQNAPIGALCPHCTTNTIDPLTHTCSNCGQADIFALLPQDASVDSVDAAVDSSPEIQNQIQLVKDAYGNRSMAEMSDDEIGRYTRDLDLAKKGQYIADVSVIETDVVDDEADSVADDEFVIRWCPNPACHTMQDLGQSIGGAPKCANCQVESSWSDWLTIAPPVVDNTLPVEDTTALLVKQITDIITKLGESKLRSVLTFLNQFVKI